MIKTLGSDSLKISIQLLVKVLRDLTGWISSDIEDFNTTSC